MTPMNEPAETDSVVGDVSETAPTLTVDEASDVLATVDAMLAAIRDGRRLYVSCSTRAGELAIQKVRVPAAARDEISARMRRWHDDAVRLFDELGIQR